MPDETKLVKVVKLVLGQWLPKAIENTVNKTLLSFDEFVQRRMVAGASDAQIIQELTEDLKSESSRVFGQFQSGMKTNVFGAAQIASSNGMAVELKGQPSDRLYRWQAVGDTICPDCLERHGQEDTLEGWMSRGLPKQFASRCTVYCNCELVDTGIDLPPIKGE